MNSTADDNANAKTCFVIGPIGPAESETRRKANFLLRGIIAPACKNSGLNITVTRADEISDPGLITDQIISRVIDADLVIADLSGHNENAFYELAIRHSTGKPTIHVIASGETIPFDIKDYRTLEFEINDIDRLRQAEEALTRLVQACFKPGFEGPNPLTRALAAKEMRASADPVEKLIIDQIDKLASFEQRLKHLETTTEHGRFRDQMLRQLRQSNIPPIDPDQTLAAQKGIGWSRIVDELRDLDTTNDGTLSEALTKALRLKRLRDITAPSDTETEKNTKSDHK